MASQLASPGVVAGIRRLRPPRPASSRRLV
jgi:hypothetical protein